MGGGFHHPVFRGQLGGGIGKLFPLFKSFLKTHVAPEAKKFGISMLKKEQKRWVMFCQEKEIGNQD